MQLGCAPFLATHIEGDTAWVNVLYVPPWLRRRGIGRTVFRRWARTIPTEIVQIKLLAIDLDGGSPIGFWRKMGFECEAGEIDGLEGAALYMAKPANEITRTIASDSCRASQEISVACPTCEDGGHKCVVVP